METQHSSGRRIAALLGLVAGFLLLAAIAAVGVTTTALPGCEGCHYDRSGFKSATLAASHGDTPCVSCHVDTGSLVERTKFGVYEAYGMYLPLLDTEASDIGLVRDGRCLSCHKEVETRIVKSDGLIMKHASCAKGRRCVDCHSEVGHGSATSWARVTSMNDCVSCHKKTRNSLKCETCHAGRGETKSIAEPEFAVTHGPNWQKTHGMGQMSVCSVCHDENKCARCHGAGVPHATDFIQQHPALSTGPDAKCTTCHRKKFCDDCHQLEMPHPKRFAAAHSRMVKAEGDQKCLRCHAKTDCEGCHVKHIHPGGSVGPSRDKAKGGS